MNQQIAINLGQQIQSRRKVLSITQKDLAEIAGISLRSLIDIENGKGNPTLQALASVGEVLGLELLFMELVTSSATSSSMSTVNSSSGTSGSKTLTSTSTSTSGSITGTSTANR